MCLCVYKYVVKLSQFICYLGGYCENINWEFHFDCIKQLTKVPYANSLGAFYIDQIRYQYERYNGYGRTVNQLIYHGEDLIQQYIDYSDEYDIFILMVGGFFRAILKNTDVYTNERFDYLITEIQKWVQKLFTVGSDVIRAHCVSILTEIMETKPQLELINLCCTNAILEKDKTNYIYILERCINSWNKKDLEYYLSESKIVQTVVAFCKKLGVTYLNLIRYSGAINTCWRILANAAKYDIQHTVEVSLLMKEITSCSVCIPNTIYMLFKDFVHNGIHVKKNKLLYWTLGDPDFEWYIERILWIGWSKNMHNENCMIKILPLQLFKMVLSNIDVRHMNKMEQKSCEYERPTRKQRHKYLTNIRVISKLCLPYPLESSTNSILNKFKIQYYW